MINVYVGGVSRAVSAARTVEFATGEAKSGKEFFRRRQGLIISFLISFTIISLMWNGHDKLFSHVRRLTPFVTGLNFIFMICIVWIPVATALTNFKDRESYICYSVTMFTNRLLLAIIGAVIRRDPRMWARASGNRVFGRGAEVADVVAVALFALAGILAVFGPLHGYSRNSFYAVTGLRLPIVVALKRLFPALMTDALVINK